MRRIFFDARGRSSEAGDVAALRPFSTPPLRPLIRLLSPPLFQGMLIPHPADAGMFYGMVARLFRKSSSTVTAAAAVLATASLASRLFGIARDRMLSGAFGA